VSQTSSIFTGQIMSPTMSFGIIWDNHSCQILSVDSGCLLLSPLFTNASQGFSSSSRLHLGSSKHWQCRTGRPRQTWLRMVDDDLHPLNFSLAMARRCAWNRSSWRLLTKAAMSSLHVPERERERRAGHFAVHIEEEEDFAQA